MNTVCLFAYDFPHRKTHDFICDIMAHSDIHVIVIAAPRKKLASSHEPDPFKPALVTPPPQNTKELCEALDVPFYVIAHEDSKRIAEVASKHQATAAIISGARIIPRETIEVFSDGIVNFHPGPIPETSGLDSFFHMLKASAIPTVTTHFIDHRVDAGKLIFTHEVEINEHTTPEVLKENLYQTQRIALLELIKNFNNIKTSDINRPVKNEPLTAQEKELLYDKFDAWKSEILNRGN